MSNKSNLLSALLRSLADRIDNGSCVMTEEQTSMLIDSISNRPMSKEQASLYLNMSRSNFDRLIREGKLPPGRKVAGFKELFWFSAELRNYAE